MINFSLDNACVICLAPGHSVNHLDHLAVIGYTLQLPIIIDDDTVYQSLLQYYPQITPIYIQEHQRVLAYLAEHYDTLFISCAHYRGELAPIFEDLFKKKMRFCYCPHGNSDKSIDHFRLQNFSLIYGDQMEDRLRKMDMLSQLTGYVRTGNYRLSFYRKYETFYDQIIEEQVFSHFTKKQPIILYAPTWPDMEDSSSLLDVGISIIDQLPDHYNLIIKLHPWAQYYQPGFVCHIQEKYRERHNIKILALSPLIFPLLKRTDIYLGDFSSIGYDFLYFNRPMFFFDASKRMRIREEATHLHSCGMLIPEISYQNIYRFIDKNLHLQNQYIEKRKKLYHYAFGEMCSLGNLRKDIIKRFFH